MEKIKEDMRKRVEAIGRKPVLAYVQIDDEEELSEDFKKFFKDVGIIINFYSIPFEEGAMLKNFVNHTMDDMVYIKGLDDDLIVNMFCLECKEKLNNLYSEIADVRLMEKANTVTFGERPNVPFDGEITYTHIKIGNRIIEGKDWKNLKIAALAEMVLRETESELQQ